MICRNLVFSGGGIKGVAHLGVLIALEERGILHLDQIRRVAGSSAGSIIAMLIALGCTLDEIWEIMVGVCSEELVQPNPLLFMKHRGMETGQKVLAYLERFIERKSGNRHLTLAQMYQLTGIEFTAVGSCLNTKEPVYFSHHTWPHLRVSIAVRISICMPGLFTPVDLEGKEYLDGSILDDLPMDLFQDEMEDTLGSLISSAFDTSYQHPEEYPMAVMNLFLSKFFRKNTDSYRSQLITITGIPSCVSMFTFRVEPDCIQQLRDAGYRSAQEYLDHRFGEPGTGKELLASSHH